MTRFSIFSDELPFIQCGNKQKNGIKPVDSIRDLFGMVKTMTLSTNRLGINSRITAWITWETCWVFERNPTNNGSSLTHGTRIS